MRDEYVEEAVAVHIPQRDSHVGLALPQSVDSDAAKDRLLGKRAVVLVDPQPIGLAVIGHQDVRPAVTVEVGAGHSQPRARNPAQV